MIYPQHLWKQHIWALNPKLPNKQKGSKKQIKGENQCFHKTVGFFVGANWVGITGEGDTANGRQDVSCGNFTRATKFQADWDAFERD